MRDYAYLGEWREGKIIFLARIPDIKFSKLVTQQHDRRSVCPPNQTTLRALSSPIFFYVELTTEEFKNRLVMLTRPDADESKMQNYCKSLQVLCEEDIEKIKKEILEAPGNAITPKLKEYIQKLNADKTGKQC